MKGFLLIDKEKGATSFDVVREVRRITGVRKVGHAGTLDPFATGLLVVAVGEGTKLLEFFVGCDKEYEVSARFGYVSDTYDCEGEIVECGAGAGAGAEFCEGDILKIIEEKFLGEISQVPPKYSALKIGGRKACDVMRSGGDVEMKERKVRIDLFEIVDFAWPRVSFRVKCGSGTYIRSLVHDLGMELGCGAYAEELRRTKVGDFRVLDAVKGGELDKKIDQAGVSLENVAKRFDVLVLDGADFEGLKDGRVLKGKKIDHNASVMAFYKDKLVGVLEKSSDELGIKYKKVIK